MCTHCLRFFGEYLGLLTGSESYSEHRRRDSVKAPRIGRKAEESPVDIRMSTGRTASLEPDLRADFRLSLQTLKSRW